MTPEEDQLTIDQAYNQPSVIATPIEAVIARKMVLRAWWVGPIIVGVAWAIRGFDGAWAAAVGVAIVAVNFLVAGELLSRAAGVSLKVYHAAALLGFFVRLGFITLSMFIVASLVEIDRPAMGVAAVVAYMVLLSLEAWALMNGERKELEWSR
ncbi:MAG: hypothetical protein GY720_23005 [bacterium]|nr:hypothetical protein [bacterium]